MALEALGTRRAFGEADVYINDEKNSRVKGNLTTTIPVTPCFPQKWGEQASRRRLFSDLVIIRGTRLDPQSFPTVDKVPRRNKNYVENEQAMYMTYNRELKKFLGELIAKNATCIHSFVLYSCMQYAVCCMLIVVVDTLLVLELVMRCGVMR